MTQEGVYVESLIGEYNKLLQECAQKPKAALSEENLGLVADVLRRCGDWSERGAEEITRLAKDYGAFMLRNALAIAVVLEREDGELGF